MAISLFARTVPAARSRGKGHTVRAAAPSSGICYRFLPLVLALAAVCSLLVALHHGGLDDAFISYRYARNLAAGHGLVFNPGERVAGFSNLLYVLMLAPAFRLGLEGSAIYGLSVLLNIAASLFALLLFAFHLRRRFGGAAAFAGTLLLAAWPTLWYWNATGMETSWVLLCQVAAWIAVERHLEGKRRGALGLAAVSAALCALLRSDGFVFPVLLALYLFLRRERRAALTIAAAAALPALGVIAWQWRYYGQPLGNPYYVKVCGPPATRLSVAFQMLAASRTMWLYWLALAIYAVSAAAAWVRTRDFTRVPSGVFVAIGLLLYFVAIGGDFLGERFLLFQAPIAVVGLFAGQVLDLRESRLRSLWIVGAILLYQAATPTTGTARLQDVLFGRGKRMQGTFWKDLGWFLRQNEPGKSLAVDAAGYTPYYSGLYTIDMLGLCDDHIARLPPASHFVPGHSKYDAQYILDRRPDLIAAWASDDRGDLFYGLERSRWDEDYAIKYLVYAENRLPPPDWPSIIDASRLTSTEIALRFREGYRYMVLARKPFPTPGSPGEEAIHH